MERGADITQDRKRITAIEIAAEEGNTDIVFTIFNKTNDQNRQSQFDKAFYAASTNGHLDITLKLVEKSNDQVTAIVEAYHNAHRNGKIECAFALLEKLPQSYNRQTLLDKGLAYAAEHNQTKDILKFLQAGANIEYHDKNGMTPLLLAAEHGGNDAIATLIDQKANVKAVNNKGENALHLAAAENYPKTVVALLESGKFDVNQKDHDGDTALHLVIIRTSFLDIYSNEEFSSTENKKIEEEQFREQISKRSSIISALLKHGAFVDEVNSRDKTPLALSDPKKNYGETAYRKAFQNYLHQKKNNAEETKAASPSQEEPKAEVKKAEEKPVKQSTSAARELTNYGLADEDIPSSMSSSSSQPPAILHNANSETPTTSPKSQNYAPLSTKTVSRNC